MSFVLDIFTRTYATVWPFEGVDDWTGGESYGAPYQVLVTFNAIAEQMTANDGREFTAKSDYWTSDQRPQYLDRIALGEHAGDWRTAGADQIQYRRVADASIFGAGQVDIRLAV